VQEIFTAGDPFRDVPNVLVAQVVIVENKRPDRPDDVDDDLWSLWSEGWNQDAAMRPDMEKYVERLTLLV
jgi:Protein tyrosine and serine/threonine kinase